jgi:hypothetical protein
MKDTIDPDLYRLNYMLVYTNKPISDFTDEIKYARDERYFPQIAQPLFMLAKKVDD